MSVRKNTILMSKNIDMNGTKKKADALHSSRASVFVLAAGCMWGLMGLLVRSLNTVGIAAMEVCFIRSIVTFASLFIGILLFDKKAFRIRLKDIWCFIGTGACSVTFFNFCYFKTMALTSLSVAAVLLYTAPAFVMLMSAVLFKEKLSLQKLAALVFAFLGCAFVSGIAGGALALSASGIIYGLLSGFGYALYSIFGRYALEKGYGSLTISFYTFLCSTVCTFFLSDKGSIVSVLSGNVLLILRTVVHWYWLSHCFLI